MLWTCAKMYLYARQPLAGGLQGHCTYTNLRRRLAPALEVITVVCRTKTQIDSHNES
jgi:hypothetical protein